MYLYRYFPGNCLALPTRIWDTEPGIFATADPDPEVDPVFLGVPIGMQLAPSTCSAQFNWLSLQSELADYYRQVKFALVDKSIQTDSKHCSQNQLTQLAQLTKAANSIHKNSWISYKKKTAGSVIKDSRPSSQRQLDQFTQKTADPLYKYDWLSSQRLLLLLRHTASSFNKDNCRLTFQRQLDLFTKTENSVHTDS